MAPTGTRPIELGERSLAGMRLDTEDGMLHFSLISEFEFFLPCNADGLSLPRCDSLSVCPPELKASE